MLVLPFAVDEACEALADALEPFFTTSLGRYIDRSFLFTCFASMRIFSLNLPVLTAVLRTTSQEVSQLFRDAVGAHQCQ